MIIPGLATPLILSTCSSYHISEIIAPSIFLNMNSYNSLDLCDSCHFIQEEHLMNARQKHLQIHLPEWIVRFADQKASGLTVRQWCKQNNLSFHTYNYWKHLLREKVVDQTLPDIIPLSLPVLSDSGSSLETVTPNICSIRVNCSIRSNNSNVQMQIKGISIEIDSFVCI